MKLKLNRALCASTAMATGLLMASAALAQSTATQVQELVVTGAHGQPNIAGVITQVQEAKDVSIVGQTFIAHQAAGQNFAQLINLLPGVTYTTEDAYGNLSSDLHIHGFDSAHIGVTIDGVPVNDTGNYALYPGEYLTPELTDHVIVNLGATSVDSPTASAVGGTVEVVTKLPTKDPEVISNLSAGSFDYSRYYLEADSGEVGPWGTRMFLSGNYDHYDKWVGSGDEMKEGLDARIYQPLKGSDFLSLSASYLVEHDYFYESSSPAQFANTAAGAGKNTLDFNTQWAVPTAIDGKADTTGSGTGPGFLQGSADSNFWALHPNPVIFGTIRGASKFSLTDSLTFTFDPSFFYTLANGGGVTALSETDPRLKGNCLTCRGVDLNGDGDVLDTVNVYSPSNTNTRRYGLTSSLLWDLDEHNHFSLGYTLDYGMHRQTGEMGYIDQATGMPGSIFGGKQGWGSTDIVTDDGSIMRSRDRHSIAELNQFDLNYIGKFIDDKLHVNVGIRDPYFKRDLEQFCYTYNGTSAYCDTIAQSLVQAAYNAGVAAGNTNALSTLLFGKTGSISFDTTTKTPNFRMPFSQSFNYNKVLPNAGATYRITDDQMVYATYAEGFSAPKTDDLYSSTTAVVQPETSDAYAVGWRYQSSVVTSSFSLWDTEYHNRIVQSYDPTDPTLSIDRNIGDVRLYGVDLEAGAQPWEHFTIYASGNYTQSDVLSNEIVATSGALPLALPTKGKELVLQPKYSAALSTRYDFGWIDVGANVKYLGKRWIDDMNTAQMPDVTTVDLDGRMPITWWGAQNTYLQFNIMNFTNTRQPIHVSSVSNANAVVLTPTYTKPASTYYYYYNQPRTFMITLHAQF
ncbi:TonB-dependent receptor [Phenylobacterium sp.]|uniref:TonB-dependent receptor n=1 Tax=Phenylobacterium sp. TaxID=1871053 RepID=UPI0011F52B89|nr:TonB-dependent receptor [Phenylobacterium sp.]THD60427.1 MAG: TonB-dependent receptor [Phenylobacterium sp.]